MWEGDASWSNDHWDFVMYIRKVTLMFCEHATIYEHMLSLFVFILLYTALHSCMHWVQA